jgi:RNA polymerase sigma factor (sigma-70 family)
MSENKKYTIAVKRQRVEVSDAIYCVYYKEREAERYQNKLWVALRSLSEDERPLIHELFFNKKSESQIAKSIGVNQSTISRRLSKILSKLKSLIEK